MPLDMHRIRETRPGTEFHYFRTVGSTMTEAAKLAALGAPHGTVVIADEQTAGMGRLGRSWHSEAELGIYCSILLDLPLAPCRLPIASLIVGLATADAIQKSTHLACDLRWPNDLLIQERKVAGILTHLADTCVVAGIGINVNHTSLTNDLRTPATSLRIESNGQDCSRENLLLNLLESVDIFCAVLETDGCDGILRAFTAASSYAINRRITIEENGETGVTAGLDENGFLLVQFDSGGMGKIASGGVRAEY